MIAIATVIIGLILAIILFMFMRPKKAPKEKEEELPNRGGIIYGSMNCRYTVKQIEKYPDYTYVDCAAGTCPGFVSAFPTTQHPDGSLSVGFS